METVARSKLQEGGLWQAGLLEVVVNGKVEQTRLSTCLFPLSSHGPPSCVAFSDGAADAVACTQVTDALGLGDVVFPSMLAGWALREDGKAARAQAEERGEVAGEMPKSGLYSKATMGGYAFGCFLCEVRAARAFRASGLPLLWHITPHGLFWPAFSSRHACLTRDASSRKFFNSGGGQPALLFLIPPMLLLALSVAGGKGDLGRFLKE